MTFSFGAQPTPTNTGYAFNGGTNSAASPPPIPAGNPFNQQQQYQQGGYNMAQPSMYWQQLGYMGIEPTIIDVIADLIRDNEDSATFFAGGGFEAISQIISETIDNRLKEFFVGMVLVQTKGDEGQSITYSVEKSSDESKAIATKSKAELTAAIQGISTSVKEQLLAPRQNTSALHRQAASAQASQGMIGGMLAESMVQPNGLGQKAGSAVGGILRSTLGLPPAPQPQRSGV